MLDFDLTAEGLPELLRDLDNLDDLVLDEMASTMRRSVDVLEAAVVQRTPVGATSQARQGWGTSVERGIAAVKGTVANPVQHTIFAEKGRAPGKMPPLAPIELWVRRVLGVDPAKSRQVAFLVARAIGRRGTKGAHMAEEGLAAVRPQIQADFEGVPARVARRFER